MTPRLELLDHVLSCSKCKITVTKKCIKEGESWPNGCYDEPEYTYFISDDSQWEYCEEGDKLWTNIYGPPGLGEV